MRTFPVFALVLAFAAFAQQAPPSGGDKLPSILARMKSEDLHTKIVAFNELMTHVASEAGGPKEGSELTGRSDALNKFFSRHPEQADQVKLGLIQLLTKENYYFIEGKNPPPDDHAEDDVSEHYAELINTVSSLNDDRAIPALAGAVTTGGMAQRGLLKYGDKALDPLLKQLRSPDGLVRASALGMAITVLEGHNDPEAHNRVRELLQALLADPESVVRRKAVWEIDCLDDRQDFVPILEKIAKTDPEKRSGKADDGGDGDAFYPVRYDARRVLHHIQNNKPCGSEY
ncbi:MAG TPA: HEAT repeat domain-containing protein [Terriglobales bacterium]|nr:HEAT repeat domain-containing protein [Terriglobales bacterium]